MNRAVRAIVVDDAVLLREGIRAVLEDDGIEVVASCASADELWAVLRSIDTVDAVVLDIRMPPTHTDEGMRALERLRAEGSRIGVLMLSMYASSALAIRAISAGASTGYLLKDRVTDAAMLTQAVRTVASGGSVVDPEVVQQLVVPAGPRTRLDALSPREKEVLALMAEGRSNTGIADSLRISPRTIESHVDHILTKLEVDTDAGVHRRVLGVLLALHGVSHGAGSPDTGGGALAR